MLQLVNINPAYSPAQRGLSASLALHILAAAAIFTVAYPVKKSITYEATALYLPAGPIARQPKIAVPRKMATAHSIAPRTLAPLPPMTRLVSEPAAPAPVHEPDAAIPAAPVLATLSSLELPRVTAPMKPRIEVRTGQFEATTSGAIMLASVVGVQTGQFDSSARPEARPERARLAANGSFGDAAAQAASTANRSVSAAQFEAVAASPSAHRAVSAVALSEPIEILAKPKPIYTEEARRLGIQGEVVLEVLFRSTAQISVLRVVRGLGHGLDASAERAALGIRFHPAAAGGRPIDSVATVKIEFQLAD
jgi:TonB family protein